MSAVTWPPKLELRRWGSSGPSSLMDASLLYNAFTNICVLKLPYLIEAWVAIYNWKQMTHTYASVNWVIIDSGNGLSPVQCQTISWTNDGLLKRESGYMNIFFQEIPLKIRLTICESFASGCWHTWNRVEINGLVQDCGNSSANALELPQSCTKPLQWCGKGYLRISSSWNKSTPRWAIQLKHFIS